MPGKDNRAEYRRLMPGSDGTPALRICLLKRDDAEKTNADPGLSSYDLEAAHIAKRIRDMIDSHREIIIRENGKLAKRPCTAGDFAVLMRSSGHLYSLERQLKHFGVPSVTEKPAELFKDAPVNDLCNFIRLLVYPEDRAAYAALIRSPFLRLGDLALAACMLHGGARPFDSAVEPYLSPGDLERYRKGRERYEVLREEARACSVTELLTKLWYYEGYRYETIWSSESQSYAGFFDLLFELAVNTDARGKTLADFIDYLEDLVKGEEKPDETFTGADRGSGVRIMTIHKSKGLEFPVVFVYGCAAAARNLVNDKAIYNSGKWGPVLNVPQAEETPSGKGSYFFNTQKEEEKRMEIAELKRLLYVAMTRAEYELYLTAALPKESKKPAGEKTIRSFFDLLDPVLPACTAPLFGFDDIREYTRKELAAEARTYAKQKTRPAASLQASARGALPFYEKAEIIETPEPASLPVPASSLRREDPRTENGAGVQVYKKTELDRTMERIGLEPADLGTMVHAFLEDHFNKRKPRIPPAILSRLDEADWPAAAEAAEKLSRGFLESDLGRMSLAASYRESEFPVITAVTLHGGGENRNIPVAGKIDLLFEAEGTIHVVDFKTDRDERQDDHLGQLAVYKQAAEDIFGKKTRVWLYYLRAGRAVEPADIDMVDIPAMVHSCLKDHTG
jgi:ATP-dependent helicase/nuclease subunit A